MSIQENISHYIQHINSSSNEAQIKTQFIILLGLLFPEKSKQLRDFAQGTEHFIKYTTKSTKENNRGFIDSFYGNLIIEFKYKLHREDHEKQLKEYISKIWSNQEEKESYICIGSDGIEWILYSPLLKENENQDSLDYNRIDPDHIRLVKNEIYIAKKEKSEEFYQWLDRIFFRENNLKPTSKLICTDFGESSFSCQSSKDILHKLFNRAKNIKEVKVAFSTWQEYLKYTYGNIIGSSNLFLSHTYLSGFIKLLMAHIIADRNERKLSISDIPDILTGKFFYELNIKNYVEKDFFFWINFGEISDVGIKIWQPLFHALKTYDFSKINTDFLKDIYQDLIDPEDRHDLGEYYTPDWLCEKIVCKALKNFNREKNEKIADITCGSGSFLKVAISYLRNKKYLNSIDEISNSVIGFEIHPLAVFIARTNYMLVLEDLLHSLSKPFTIPIYLCDSLLNNEMNQSESLKDNKFQISISNEKINFPINNLLTDKNFDEIIDYIENLIESMREQKKDFTVHQFNFYMKNFIISKYSLHDTVKRRELIESFSNLAFKISKNYHGSSVIFYVIKNNYRPAFMRNFFTTIIGNPPWLSFRYIESEDYRDELEYLGLKKYKIAPKDSNLRTQMELATIFLAHSVDYYLKERGEVFFVMPRSIYSANQHDEFRNISYDLDMKLKEIWDLTDVRPLFKIPSCVIMAEKTKKIKIKNLNGVIISGKLPSQNCNYKEAKNNLIRKSGFYNIKKINQSSAINFSDKSLVSSDINIIKLDLYYKKRFKQGATIVPRNFYFIDSKDCLSSKKVVTISTNEHINKNAKSPYKNVLLKGRTEIKFIFKTCIAENILPFAVINPFLVHLPIQKTQNTWSYISPSKMQSEGKINSGKWFNEVEKKYHSLSNGKMTFFERINYHNGLLSQNPEEKYWILYCASGKHMCAAFYENKDLFWVDSKLYWHTLKTKKEAHYLAGVLNATSLNEMIKPFQTQGLLGERDIHKKILDIGIPRYNSENELIVNISKLAENLSKKIQKYVKSLEHVQSLGHKRNKIRKNFKESFLEIDESVEKLFQRK